ncbi:MULTISPECIES: TauD/TfdA family dioxygenase [Streptomyces]|uniref:TauD/TfdA family dioxygenase n=1 Tax=Streptomyces TaxID=1883 RepID=UPI0006EB6274|nr:MULTISPECIES: TauD/TfdA family dioxygenase [Streptomyces]
MVRGTFVERDSDPHVALRGALLDSGRRLPAPRAAVPRVRPGGLAEASAGQLAAHGLFLGVLDTPLDDDGFIAFGDGLGELIPETDPAVRAHTAQQVLLNLSAVHSRTDDVSLQPFAEGPLTLHSEGSGRAVAEQPRHIALMCCDPGRPAGHADGAEHTPAQTVLVPMAAVHEALTPAQRALLRVTRYRSDHPVPTVLREAGGRPVFSFRDFDAAPLHWESDTDDGTAAEVNDAFRALLAAMYAPETAAAVHWARGTVAVIDNTYFFHGRTAGTAVVSAAADTTAQQTGSQRHLKRLRIRATRPEGER